MPLIILSSRRLNWSQWAGIGGYLLFAAFCCYVFSEIGQLVPFPFIDEIFHIRQCQVYCNYDFFHWDNKITTPPGLYIIGFLYSKLLSVFFWTRDLCQNIDVLRSVNLVGGLVVFPFILALFKRFNSAQFLTVNIIAQPLLFTYYFLFYTDIWSTILIIWSVGLVLIKPLTTKRCCFSALVGFASLWFRQTNIVWLAFVASMVIDRRIVLERGQNITPIGRAGLFIKQLFKDYVKVIPFAVNFILFLMFLKINGGITLGDNENHEISIHLVQIFYCFTFIVMFTWPVWLQLNTLVQYGQFLFGNFGLNLAFNSVSFVTIRYIINNYTIVHPFLLADNRHFTFYIYRKLIAHKYSEFIAIPLYHFSTWAIVTTLLKSKRLALSPITVVTFIGATCLTLIPSPLFEPRYYIVPLIIFRLFSKPASKVRSVYEFVWLNLINIITILVFMKYEIIWESEGESIQRIIW